MILFIVGCDRSGTHLLAKTLNSSTSIEANKTGEDWYEPAETFQPSIAMARNPGRKTALLPHLIDAYKKKSKEKEIFVVKDHPNLWLWDELSEAFPDAYFLGIIRDPVATVSSMLQHQGCVLDMQWALCYPVPCPFMGIESNTYFSLGAVERAAAKWKSHYDRIMQLNETFGMDVIHYEQLINYPVHTAKNLGRLCNVDDIRVPEVRKNSLNKWTEVFSKEAAKRIREITLGD